MEILVIRTLPAPVAPIDLLVLPTDLDGTEGLNRAPGTPTRLSARNDLEAVRAWVSTYAGTPTTFMNYRKEAERLLLWSVVELRKPLSSLTHEDLLAFGHFLSDPQPASRWVLAASETGRSRRHPRDHPEWRPFSGPLSPASQRQALIILNGMFEWLVDAEYLRGNPMALLKRRKREGTRRVSRFLPDALWNEVVAYVSQLPKKSDIERAHYARSRWVTSLFFLTGMRISEVAAGTMGQFRRRIAADGDTQWWLNVIGKGDRERDIPVSKDLVAELTSYRRQPGLTLHPDRDESTPLLIPLRGDSHNMTTMAVHKAVKRIFTEAADWLETRGPEFADRAAELRGASAHWLRHTAGSHQAGNGMDLLQVRDNLGHSSVVTTNIYLHTEDEKRHRDTVAHQQLKWNSGNDVG
jgi:site-specific recombinase XerD